jgi:type IV pilus assembly protein PilC
VLTYKYIARNKQGKLKQGFLDVHSEDELVHVLQSQGLIVVSFKEADRTDKAVAGPKKKYSMRSGVRLDDLITFAKQLQVLLGSGITLLRSLEIISLQVQSRNLFHAIEQIKKDVSAGNSLKAAIVKYPKIFSTLWVNIINTGETTGQLPFALEQLVTYLESSASLQCKIKNALVYPAIVISVAVAAVTVFVVKIIPMFADIYSSFDAQLPAFTQVIFAICLNIKRYLLLFIGIIAAIVIGISYYRKTNEGRKRIDAILLNFIVIGDIIKQIATVRFASGLHMLIKSGAPILHALEIVSEISSNVVIRDMIQNVKESVREGKSMSKPIMEAGVFPDMLAHMIAVGEESGSLADMLNSAAKFYEERVDATITRLTTMFEPVLIIIIGVIVGALIIAMFLPIFSLSSAIK